MKAPDVLSVRYKRDPGPALRACVEAGPIVRGRVPLLGRVDFVTTHAAIQHLLKDSARFAVDGRNAGLNSQAGIGWSPKSLRRLAQNMLTLDDPDHRRLRKLADGPFRPAEIARLEPAIADLADRLLAEMEADGNTDLVDGFCKPLPLLVICELLGLPEADRPKLADWMSRLDKFASPIGVIRALPAILAMSDYLRGRADAARLKPPEGLIAALVQAEAERGRLSEDELIAMLFMLFIAGHETTTHLLSTGMLTLLQRQDTLEALRADPGLWPGAVEELARFNAPVQMSKPRFARADMEFHGVRLSRGQRLMALLAAGNRDPLVFDAPDRFDVRREKTRHLGFGGGVHLCLGLQLARAEARIGLQTVFDRWPDMKLSVPEEDLSWIKRVGMRGLTTLPVDYAPASSRAAAMKALAH